VRERKGIGEKDKGGEKKGARMGMREERGGVEKLEWKA